MLAGSYFSPEKPPEKIKAALCYEHYVMDITLQILHL